MTVPSSYHTHTVFCDGRDTPEELVQTAVALGCPAIGFSGHSYTAFDERYCMSEDGTAEYRRQVTALKEKYAGVIRILLGVEQDYYADAPTDGYDYVIGSVHYVLRDGVYLPVDESAELQQQIVREHFGGDFYAFAEAYYALVGDVYDRTGCTIVGHFDLITKFNENGVLFDQKHPRYRAAAGAALERLLAAPVTFEINTGAIARGYRTTPYPEPWMLQRIRAAGRPTVRTSDCHDRRQLLFGLYEDGQAVG